MSGYAKYIARVGGLAVTLGVGVALATAQGSAWAETGSESPSDSPASAASDATTPTPGSATGSTGATASSVSSTSATPGDSTTTGMSTPKVSFDSSGGALTSSDSDSADTGMTVDGKGHAPNANDGAGGKMTPAASVNDKKPSSHASATTAAPKRPKPTASHIPSVENSGQLGSLGGGGPVVQPASVGVTHAAVTSVPVAEVARQSALTPATADRPQVVPTPQPVVKPLASTVLSAVGLAPDAGGGAPQMPADSPVLLAGLAAFRRQTQQGVVSDDAASPPTPTDPSLSSLTLTQDAAVPPMLMAAALTTNSAPALGVQPTGIPDPVTGVVTGTVIASDANPLTYTVAGTPTGGGQVSINPTTGSYTYTPTPAQRLAAGTTPGADIDTFTVSVSDGQATTTGTVPVYVSPTQLNVGTPIAVQRNPAGVASYQNTTYVINQYDKTVSVIDTNPNSATFNKVIGTIKLASSPSDIVLNSTGTRAYVAMKGNASVAVIDTQAKTVITNVKVGSTPAGIAISPDNSRVYVTNGGSSTVSVIDTNLNKEISRITVGSQPSGIAVSPDGKKLYVTLRYADSLAVVNLADNTKTLIKVGDSPRDVALTPDGKRAYVTNYDATVSVIDTTTNTQLTKIATGGAKLQPVGVALSPDGTLAYVANGKDTLSVINTKTNTIVQTLTIDPIAENGAHSVVLSPDGTRIYVTDYHDATLRTLSLTRGNTAPLTTAAPTLSDPNVYTGAVSGSTAIVDPDGDPLTYQVTTQRDGTVTFDATTGNFTYTPTQAARYQASYSPGLTDNITIRATDPAGAYKDVIVTVPVSPSFNPNTGVTTGTINIGGTNKYYVTSAPIYGSLTVDENTGDYTYTSYEPNDGYFALWYDSFSWEAADGQSTTTGTVTVDTYVDPYILYGYTW
jgi:YVTN family beta-propeller protein